jgi:glyoxylase-like metal-dependent hydrolase (beta-lactamase superfamily II)
MGKHFEDMGAPKPVPEERITTVSEIRTQLDVGSRSLELVHTPGHSPDHLAVWDSETGILFANEGIGEYLPSAKTWLPPATLPNFDIETVKNSIRRLRNLAPSILAFAHFGEWDSDPEAAFDTALDRLVYFDERIPEIHEETRDVELTTRRVRSELLDLEPAYGEDVSSFYASLQTKGFLKANGML